MDDSFNRQNSGSHDDVANNMFNASTVSAYRHSIRKSIHQFYNSNANSFVINMGKGEPDYDINQVNELEVVSVESGDEISQPGHVGHASHAH